MKMIETEPEKEYVVLNCRHWSNPFETKSIVDRNVVCLNCQSVMPTVVIGIEGTTVTCEKCGSWYGLRFTAKSYVLIIPEPEQLVYKDVCDTLNAVSESVLESIKHGDANDFLLYQRELMRKGGQE